MPTGTDKVWTVEDPPVKVNGSMLSSGKENGRSAQEVLRLERNDETSPLIGQVFDKDFESKISFVHRNDNQRRLNFQIPRSVRVSSS